MIWIEHRPVAGRLRRAGRRWPGGFTSAKREMVAHVFVACDGQETELVSCRLRLVTSASDAAGGREEAAQRGWVAVSREDGRVRDFCPRCAAEEGC